MKTFLTVICLGASTLLLAQNKVPSAPSIVRDPAEGAKALAGLRTARLEGDYAVRFTLKHTPGKTGSKISYDGELYGTWRGDGPRILVRLRAVPGGPVLVSLLTQGGSSPATWIWKAGDVGQTGSPVSWERLLDPLAPSLQFSAFDLQAPFLFWSENDYEGMNTEGRHEHLFRMKPPAAFASVHPGIESVRIVVDDEFQGLKKWEVIGPVSGSKPKVLRSSEINSFKKVDERYMVKEVDFRDLQNRDKTRLEMTAAALGLALPQAAFEPEKLGDATAPVDPAVLKGF